MGDFTLFFEQGWRHITDFEGYDHMVFIATLALGFLPLYWRQLCILITAFTLGHSLALAAAVLGWVRFNPDVIETLIPVTIALSAIRHIILWKKPLTESLNIQYGVILIFGLIHGLGFSNYLGMLLSDSDSFGTALFAFNLGLEFGQILILFALLGINFLVLRSFKLSLEKYRLFGGISLTLVSLILLFS